MVEHTFESVEERAVAWTTALKCVDPATLDGAACERLLDLVILVGRTEAAVKARLVKRAKEANQWKKEGHRNPDDWLAKKNGTSTGKARAERERAENLSGAPATEEALEHGDISADQAEEVAAAANADPSSEQQLLDLAKKKESMAELRRRARKVRAAASSEEERKARIRRARSFRSWTNAEGAFCFRGQGLPEDEARLLAALKPFQDAAFAAARVEGRREEPDRYAYDGFMALLTQVTTGGAGSTGPSRHRRRGGSTPAAGSSSTGRDSTDGNPAAGSGPAPDGPTGRDEAPGDIRGGGSPGPDAGNDGTAGGRLFSDGDVCGRRDQPAPNSCADGETNSGADRVRTPAKIILHVDLTAMQRGHTTAGETCEIAGVGPVAVSVARDLLGDAFLALVIAEGVDVRNVTHLGRAPTSHQRTALEARGMRCEVPGCSRTRYLEIDHVDGWAVTRRTHVDELAWLCAGRGGHHHQKTHDGFTLTGPPGNRTWHPPPRRRGPTPH